MTTQILQLKKHRDQIEHALASLLFKERSAPSVLYESMKYALLEGGKRLRGILCLYSASAVNSSAVDGVIDFACAIELIHAYSLIHDDLPCMDNADFRRGKPSCHKTFNEDIAVLAGDALLSYAFEVMAKAPVPNPGISIECIRDISKAIGACGMVGGQALDMEAQGAPVDGNDLKKIHSLKTGKLIQVSPVVGGRIAGATNAQMKALNIFGEKLGLAFQITDDLLDVEGSFELTGKKTGYDKQLNKATYPALFGYKKSKIMANEAIKASINALNEFDIAAEPLRELACSILNRKA
ncbi:MAG: polyprenyl synthetase family protein [Candidatus Theseobacter exili]|nr:polyprenyl synthetase family protein [Candidatus Theseobacter exili]